MSLNSSFLLETEKIENYLQKVKKDCDNFDKNKPTFKKQKEFILSFQKEFFLCLDKHFEKIWEIVKNLSRKDYLIHQKFYQKKLLSYFLTSPLNRRIYEKPFGYDGDYITMNYYYDDGYEGQGTMGKLFHRYTLSIPIARAVIFRLNYFEKFVKSAAQRFSDVVNIASLGSGCGREISNFLEKDRSFRKFTFHCLDFEKKALSYLQKRAHKFVNENKKIKFYWVNILDLLKEKEFFIKEQIKELALVYSFGFFDYLQERSASRLIKIAFDWLSKDGQLVISNFDNQISHQAYLNFLGNWKLILRTKEQMRQLVEKSKINPKAVTVALDPETKTNLYLLIKK